MKSGFLTELEVRNIRDDVWEVTKPLKYCSEVLNRVIEVPVGFLTDFASVPRILPIVYSICGDRAHKAATVHDYLYQTHVCTKDVADEVFLEAMKDSEIGFFVRHTMYVGVCWGGHESWKTGPARMQILGDGGK